MKISKIARREARELFRSAQIKGTLDEPTPRQVVDEVLTKKPRGYVRILEHFQRLVKLDLARRAARVESVLVLDTAQQNSVRVALTRRYGPGLNFIFAQNQALIGGMRVQVGSDVYEGSVRARLDELQSAFQAA